ncbi:hypothetical protein J1N35_011043 [Gossypium stocksii]|uniref:Uncharacterized protein n=1 Tax=Gossypium stocksii TaxID=47602 RepID=A0A9D3W3Q7_9ROSI|nr:hypothetical protein J1N35_011043 [Gossypium stocksii]
MSIKHGLGSETLREAIKNYNNNMENLEKKIKTGEDSLAKLQEKLKIQEETHKAELERLRQPHKETFKKWRSNLILHTQVAAGPLDFGRVDFNYLKEISTKLLSFNVYHLEGAEPKTFQRVWKHSAGFFLQDTPEAIDDDKNLTNVEHSPEGHPPLDKVTTRPIHQPLKGDN